MAMATRSRAAGMCSASWPLPRRGGDARQLMPDLSGAKQTNMARPQLTVFFNRSLLALNALLDGIDESQLRQP